MRSRSIVTIFRRTAYAVVALVLVLFLLVQGHQRLLRHRAERLHAEIVALQLHPGTFADVQRMQREWGKFGHYEGECTARHCIYEIGMSDWFGNLVFIRRRDVFWMEVPYSWIGGRAVLIGANVRVHEDKMWGEDFSLSVDVTARENTRKHEYESDGVQFLLFAGDVGGSRLYQTRDFLHCGPLRRGYRDGFDGFCSGCIGAEIDITPQTLPSDVAWLTEFDFSCITRWHGCQDEDELTPKAWPLRERYDPNAPDDLKLDGVPFQVLGREADEATVVEVIRTMPWGEQDQGERAAEVRVVEALKNVTSLKPGEVI